MRIQLKDRTERERTAAEIATSLRPMLQIEPGMMVKTRISSGMFSRRGGDDGSDRLSIQIRGHELEAGMEYAKKVRDAMGRIPGVAEAQISQRPGMPEMLVLVDRPRAASMGLNVSEIADALETAIGGRRTSMFREGGDEYSILVRLREQDRLALSQIGAVPLSTPVGRTVPAESVVQLKRQEGPTYIQRIDQQRILTVTGSLDDRDLGSVVADMETALRAIPRPDGFDIIFGGEYEEQQEAFRELTFASLLALALVYMVMASQFESLRDPLIILFSVPLAAIGVVLMLLLTETTFNMQAFLGVIVLVGVVVNNAIVLVDYMNLLRRDHHMELRESVVTAGSRRLRPILMTTITTVLGLAPMALGMGEGSELQAPLARTVIGGLATSTLITLVFIPVVYFTLESWKRRPIAAPVGETLNAPAPSGD
ncbi:MAG: efflux RND transporter permease subunit [Bryobacterales bacterium]